MAVNRDGRTRARIKAGIAIDAPDQRGKRTALDSLMGQQRATPRATG